MMASARSSRTTESQSTTHSGDLYIGNNNSGIGGQMSSQIMDDVNSPDEDQHIQQSMWSRIKARRNAKTQAVLRLRWNAQGESKIISQRSVENLSEISKYSNVDKTTMITPDLVPFKITRAQYLSLMIPDRANSLTTSMCTLVSGAARKSRLRMNPLVAKYKWFVSGLNSMECYRDFYDGSLPPRKDTYFTYWMTAVQIMVFAASLSIFGFTSFGFSVSEHAYKVKMPHMKSERKVYHEEHNPWIGPADMHLVVLGARYPPCMRHTPPTEAELAAEERELNTACCLRLDGSGCFQAEEKNCYMHLGERWIKWSHNQPGPQRRTYGSVCGQDPRFCGLQENLFSLRWPEKITQWPVCENVTIPRDISSKEYLRMKERHMDCKIQARPCCYGIHKQCMITTWEHCDLLMGTYHPKSFLCGQVDCAVDMCGMSRDAPHQWYRLLTTLFVHEGLLQLMCSIWFQLNVTIGLENIMGAMIIPLAFGAGIFGNLGAGIFAPEKLSAGPSSIHFAVLGSLQVLTYLKPPQRKRLNFLMPSFIVQGTVILLGFLPWVDAYGNLFGLAFGLLFSMAVLVPKTKVFFIEKQKKTLMGISMWILACSTPLMFISFFGIPTILEPIILNIKGFSYIDCIPFTETFCKKPDPALGFNLTHA